MCGIVGIVSNKEVSENILQALRRLEYRGYDSAGISTVKNNALHTLRARGKIDQLAKLFTETTLEGQIGIGHTRWATHGAPLVRNAHPHNAAEVSVVHNGIIENYKILKAELIALGVEFLSDTDTEVIPHLINFYLSENLTPLEAVQKTVARLEGAFAIAVIFANYPEVLIGAKKGSPLAVGYGDNENYLGSDAFALANFTNQISYLEENDITVITKDVVEIYDKAGNQVKRTIKKVANIDVEGKGNYRHFMLKEIYEQPKVAAKVFDSYIDFENNELKFSLPLDVAKIPKITIIACGTSYYAAFVARYWFENFANISVEIEIASEFRYRKINLPSGGVAIFISQSGETADTLAALRFAKSQNQYIISLVNVEESSIARESDYVLNLFAGTEIGVASTKAFTASLCTLASLILFFAKAANIDITNHINNCQQVPGKIAQMLVLDDSIKELSKNLKNANNILFMGRGVSYAIALEGALKLKELSYIHAEAFAAGELKHGPIALIDENIPVIAIIPPDDLFEKTLSNISEVEARGANVIIISEKSEIFANYKTIEICNTDPLTQAIIYAIPLQLIAYHTALHKGTDVDQPRNLAKSVTVE